MAVPGEGHKNITQKQQNNSAVYRAELKHQKTLENLAKTVAILPCQLLHQQLPLVHFSDDKGINFNHILLAKVRC
jgi:hypothetical protein